MKHFLVYLVVLGWSVSAMSRVGGQESATAALTVTQTGTAAAQPNRTAAEAKKDRYWSTHWSFVDVDVGKLTTRLSSIGIDVGVPLAGTVSVEFEVGVPWTSLGDAAAYRFDGTLTSPLLIVDDVRLGNVQANLVYREGTVTLTRAHADLVQDEPTLAKEATGGTIRGDGSVELVPRGEAKGNLFLDNLSLAPIAELLTRLQTASTAVPAAETALVRAGTVSAEVQFAAPLETISDIDTYHLQGSARGESVGLRGLPPATFEISEFSLIDGTFALQHFDVLAADANEPGVEIRLQGIATIAMRGDRRFEIQLVGDDVPTAAVAALFLHSPRVVEGKLDFRGSAHGQFAETWEESHWEIDASLASPRLQIAGVDLGIIQHDVQLSPSRLSIQPRHRAASLPDAVRIKQLECDYKLTAEVLSVSHLAAELFGGRFSGSAQVPLRAAGLVRADLRFSDMRPAVAMPFPSASPPQLSATLGGELKWEVPLDTLGQPAAHRGTARIRLDELQLGDEPLGWIAVSVAASEGELSLQGEGEALDGKLHVRMIADAAAEDRWSDLGERLRTSEFRFTGLSLQRGLMAFPEARWPLRGRVSGALIGSRFPNASNDSSSLRFELDMDGLRYRDVLVSQRASLRGGFDGEVVSVDAIVGDYAGGAVRIDGRVNLYDNGEVWQPRMELALRADRVDLHRGLFFVGAAADQVSGKASGAARISGWGRGLRLRGRVNGSSLVLSEFPVGAAHSAIRLDADLITQQWKLSLPTISSNVGGGWLDGELTVSSHRGRSGVDLASRWKTRRVDFFRLSQQLGSGASSRATGQITGELTIAGKAVRSVDDLAGRFQFRLGETRGAAVPGLVGISRYLGPVSLASEKFNTGAVRGILGNGVMTIDEFWLGSDAALVQADGRIYLRSKRLELDAIVATGDYSDIASELEHLIEQYVLRSLLPASAILDLSELLRDRTLVVKVLGTLDHPIVRLQPVETFREETARFLLREGRRLILAGVTAGTIDGFN